jgi:hypothetical protein
MILKKDPGTQRVARSLEERLACAHPVHTPWVTRSFEQGRNRLRTRSSFQNEILSTLSTASHNVNSASNLQHSTLLAHTIVKCHLCVYVCVQIRLSNDI